jgi:hypothetical protein
MPGPMQPQSPLPSAVLEQQFVGLPTSGDRKTMQPQSLLLSVSEQQFADEPSS